MNIRVSMDGKGRWVDNVFIEGLWRSAKYEEVCQHAYRDGLEVRLRLGEYFETYNLRRLHESTPRHARPSDVIAMRNVRCQSDEMWTQGGRCLL